MKLLYLSEFTQDQKLLIVETLVDNLLKGQFNYYLRSRNISARSSIYSAMSLKINRSLFWDNKPEYEKQYSNFQKHKRDKIKEFLSKIEFQDFIGYSINKIGIVCFHHIIKEFDFPFITNVSIDNTINSEDKTIQEPIKKEEDLTFIRFEEKNADN